MSLRSSLVHEYQSTCIAATQSSPDLCQYICEGQPSGMSGAEEVAAGAEGASAEAAVVAAADLLPDLRVPALLLLLVVVAAAATAGARSTVCVYMYM
jgi:hypothetical protein